MLFPLELEGATCEQVVEASGVSPLLAARLLTLQHWWQDRFPGLGGLRVISGFRTLEEQLELERQGRPAADPDKSTHLTCPATGADLELPLAPDDGLKWEFGTGVTFAGLRWGGGSRLERGIPLDWNHVDLGPR